MKDQILTQLKEHHQGAGKAILSWHIEKRHDLAGSAIRDIIRALRREGEPIGSCSLGYYYCATRGELEGLIKGLHGRALSMLKTVSQLEQNREKAGFKQMGLF